VELPIQEIKIGDRYRKDLGDVADLVESIRALGMLQLIVVTEDYRLIAGERRLAAAKTLGWETVPVHVAKDLSAAVDLLRAERDENTCRKDLSPLEAVALGKKIEELLRPKMKERQREHGKTAPGRAKNTSGKLTEVTDGQPKETRDAAAAAAGMGARTYAKAKAVADAAEREPEKYRDIASEMDSTGKVDRAHRKLRQKREAAKSTCEPGKRAPSYRKLDKATKALLHDAAATHDEAQMADLLAIQDENLRKAVARRVWKVDGLEDAPTVGELAKSTTPTSYAAETDCTAKPDTRVPTHRSKLAKVSEAKTDREFEFEIPITMMISYRACVRAHTVQEALVKANRMCMRGDGDPSEILQDLSPAWRDVDWWDPDLSWIGADVFNTLRADDIKVYVPDGDFGGEMIPITDPDSGIDPDEHPIDTKAAYKEARRLEREEVGDH
jgi:ParB-like chromosome segregation protein Spo0J